MSNDLINGLFELLGGLLCWLNLKMLYKDKCVRGVSIWVQLFFTFWGYWNIYFYPSLNQTFSLYGAIVMTTANTIWILLAIYYTVKERKHA